MTIGTNVPAPTWSTAGFLSPSGPAILAGVQADYSAAFNAALNFNLNTPQGQLASSAAAIIANVYSLFQFFTQQTDPAYASGRSQDGIGRIYGMIRNPALPTVLQIACVGAAGTVIPIGATISDVSGNLYTATSALTIPVGGSITGSFACTLTGPIAVPSVNQVSIYQAFPGWNSVTIVSGVVGVNVEGRAAFELRRQQSVASNSLGPVGAIIGAVAAVPGVIDFYGTNNNTNSPVTVGNVVIAANAIYICVAGGAALAIAQAILSKKGAGAPMTGNTSVTALDSNPLYPSPISYTINFQVATPLQVLFKVSIVNSAAVPSNATVLIQNALIQAFAQGTLVTNPAQIVANLRARIGNVLYATTFVPVISALGPWAQVSALVIGSANTAVANVVGHIVATTMVVIGATTGIAINQFLSDPLGLIVNGTFITGGSGASWTVNNSQTVSGAVFTATTGSPTTQLVVASVTGVIGIGNTVSVTSGILAGTTIQSQVTGTVGGAGTYVLSTTTAVTTIVVTANMALTCAFPDQTNVAVQASQVPQLAAVNILVTSI